MAKSSSTHPMSPALRLACLAAIIGVPLVVALAPPPWPAIAIGGMGVALIAALIANVISGRRLAAATAARTDDEA